MNKNMENNINNTNTTKHKQKQKQKRSALCALSTTLEKLYQNGRHYTMTIIYDETQFDLDISKKLRQNIDVQKKKITEIN